MRVLQLNINAPRMNKFNLLLFNCVIYMFHKILKTQFRLNLYKINKSPLLLLIAKWLCHIYYDFCSFSEDTSVKFYWLKCNHSMWRGEERYLDETLVTRNVNHFQPSLDYVP